MCRDGPPCEAVVAAQFEEISVGGFIIFFEVIFVGADVDTRAVIGIEEDFGDRSKHNDKMRHECLLTEEDGGVHFKDAVLARANPRLRQ